MPKINTLKIAVEALRRADGKSYNCAFNFTAKDSDDAVISRVRAKWSMQRVQGCCSIWNIAGLNQGFLISGGFTPMEQAAILTESLKRLPPDAYLITPSTNYFSPNFIKCLNLLGWKTSPSAKGNYGVYRVHACLFSTRG